MVASHGHTLSNRLLREGTNERKTPARGEKNVPFLPDTLIFAVRDAIIGLTRGSREGKLRHSLGQKARGDLS
jgi:hypothetical protein